MLIIQLQNLQDVLINRYFHIIASPVYRSDNELT